MQAAASSGLPLIVATMAQQCLQSSGHGIEIVDTRLNLAGPFLRQLLHVPALAIALSIFMPLESKTCIPTD